MAYPSLQASNRDNKLARDGQRCPGLPCVVHLLDGHQSTCALATCCCCRVRDNHLSFASAVNALPGHARVNGALGGHSPVVVWSTNKNRHPGRRSFVGLFGSRVASLLAYHGNGQARFSKVSMPHHFCYSTTPQHPTQYRVSGQSEPPRRLWCKSHHPVTRSSAIARC